MSISTKRKLLIGSFLFFFMICFIALPFVSEPAMSFSSGAPAGFCGAPGDGNSNCTSCHVGPPATVISGAILTNIPAAGYIPGTTYNVSAKISRPGHERFGFQVSPQDLAGNQIGTMNDLGAETSFTGFGKYITHSSTGTMGTDSVTWYFEWVAPPAGTGNFTFYGAFNVSDNNGVNSGDTIYITSVSYNENVSATLADSQNPFPGLVITENYFTGQVGISFQMPGEGNVKISLYDLQGKFLGELYNGFSENRSFMKNLDLPFVQSQGIFLLEIQNGNYRHTEKIFLTHN